MARNTFVAADVLTAAQMNTLQDSVWSDDVRADATTAYTLVLGDAGRQVTMSNASASTLTIPPNSSVAFTVGVKIQVIQLGVGVVTITAGAGVTASSASTSLAMVRYQTATLIKQATNTWIVQLGAGPAGASLSGFTDSATPFNTAIGFEAGTGVSVAGALRATSSGYQALKSVTTGDDNAAFGFSAAKLLTTGEKNTAIGNYCMMNATTGSNNTAVGYTALQSLTSGSANIGIGEQSVRTASSHSNCVGIGYRALYYNSASNNTAVGYYAGGTNDDLTGSNNSFFGYNAVPADRTDSNKITLGNSSVTTLRCQVTSITALSDERDKANIETSQYGLELVNMLRPVTFEWNMRDGGKVGQKDIGFIAQELVTVEDALNAHDVLALTFRSNPDKLEASYGRLMPVLVKAIQELSNKIAELEEQLK